MYLRDCANIPTEISGVKRSMDIFFICFYRSKSRDTCLRQAGRRDLILGDTRIVGSTNSQFNLLHSVFSVRHWKKYQVTSIKYQDAKRIQVHPSPARRGGYLVLRTFYQIVAFPPNNLMLTINSCVWFGSR
jgi:hypothetical protein